MNKRTLKTFQAIGVSLALAFSLQATPAQAASTSLCKYLKNTQCAGPVTIIDRLLASLANPN